MLRFAVFLLAVAVTAGAQKTKTTRPAKPAKPSKPVAAQPAPPKVFVLESVAVEGNKLYRPEQILAASGVKIGEPGDKEKFEIARNRLLDTGAFLSFAFRYGPSASGKGYALTFEVAEVEQVFPVRFEELPGTPDELRQVLRNNDPLFGEKVAGTDTMLKRYARILEAHLGGQQKVIGRVTSEGPGELFILFRPATAPMNVAQVNFTGNRILQTTTLQNTIAGVAIGVPYNEQRFRHLLDSNIRPLYDARGRVRVEFPKIAVEKAKDVNGYVVTVEVSEGDVYNLGEVTVEGVANRDELYKIAQFKPETVANFDQINAGIEKMRDRLRSQGYMKPQAKTERKVNEEKKAVDLRVLIDPGPVYKFGKLSIVGLDIVGEPAVRKLWAIKEGQPFNSGYPQYFLDRIRQDGLFDDLGKTKYELKVDDQVHVVDVTLSFAGAPPPEKKKQPY